MSDHCTRGDRCPTASCHPFAQPERLAHFEMTGMDINTAPAPHRLARIERGFENVIFGSRWLLAPFYLGLAVSLGVLLVKFVQQAIGLLVHAVSSEGNEIILGVLAL